MKLNIGTVELTPAGVSKAGKAVFKGSLDLPIGKVYVSLYGEAAAPPAAAPTPAPAAGVRVRRKKDLATPVGAGAPTPAPTATGVPAGVDLRALARLVAAELRAAAE